MALGTVLVGTSVIFVEKKFFTTGTFTSKFYNIPYVVMDTSSFSHSF